MINYETFQRLHFLHRKEGWTAPQIARELIRVKLSADLRQVVENGVKVSNKVLAFSLIISAIAGYSVE